MVVRVVICGVVLVVSCVCVDLVVCSGCALFLFLQKKTTSIYMDCWCASRTGIGRPGTLCVGAAGRSAAVGLTRVVVRVIVCGVVLVVSCVVLFLLCVCPVSLLTDETHIYLYGLLWCVFDRDWPAMYSLCLGAAGRSAAVGLTRVVVRVVVCGVLRQVRRVVCCVVRRVVWCVLCVCALFLFLYRRKNYTYIHMFIYVWTVTVVLCVVHLGPVLVLVSAGPVLCVSRRCGRVFRYCRACCVVLLT